MIIQPNDTSILKWNKNFGREKSEKFIKAQKFVDSECLRLMVPYTPTLNTGLRKSATTGTVIGNGKLVYTSPYARYQYYGKLMVSSVTGSAWARSGESKVLTPVDLNYSKSREPLAGKMWFERMKADKKSAIIRGAKELVR
ncbi:MAG: minor capsid protein [Ruminococcus sp.]|jgi:hypothetical protein|nr:minor capsid protein [Ruminococcus sp.]